MNVKLRTLLNHYQNVIDSIYDIDIYSCSELREILVRKKDHTHAKLSSAMNDYLAELAEESRREKNKIREAI